MPALKSGRYWPLQRLLSLNILKVFYFPMPFMSHLHYAVRQLDFDLSNFFVKLRIQLSTLIGIQIRSRSITFNINSFYFPIYFANVTNFKPIFFTRAQNVLSYQLIQVPCSSERSCTSAQWVLTVPRFFDQSDDDFRFL